MEFLEELQRRRTFGIISHPDAGKTTLTEKLLLFGGAIQEAGAVKSNKVKKGATSDFMEIERQRGISVSTSVLAFIYKDKKINILDTPGHKDFAEDTFRTLTAVDSVIVVIDVAKGVETQTEKLVEVCRMRNIPIIVFINKMDREGKDAFDLLDEVEQKLGLRVTPLSFPIGMGYDFKGIYNIWEKKLNLFSADNKQTVSEGIEFSNLDDPKLDTIIGEDAANTLREEIELVSEVYPKFDLTEYQNGSLQPVFFGSALNNFGVKELLDCFTEIAPTPQPKMADERLIDSKEEKLTGFVFKIQANMDPKHRDRVAFLRVCSGSYEKGKKINHVRIDKQVMISNAITFMAQDRTHVEEAFPGDIIGLHNHGTIQIGDTFTMGEALKYTGIPHFAPELFRRARLKDPLKSKQLLKGLEQLSEEGATQLFKPFTNNDLILGAVGVLQFDVVAERLKSEYKVDCIFEAVTVATARWVMCDDEKMLEEFKRKSEVNLAIDGGGDLTYIAPTRVNLELTIERWPEIQFLATREH